MPEFRYFDTHLLFSVGLLALRIKGDDGLTRTYAKDGRYLFDGTISFEGPKYEPDARGVPQKRYVYRIAPNLDGKPHPYMVNLSEEEHNVNFDAIFPTLVPNGVHVQTAKGLLQAAAVATAEQPDRVADQNGSVHLGNDGLAVNSQRYTNFYVEIVGEASDPQYGKVYRLRAKQADGQFLYYNVPMDVLNMGSIEPNPVFQLGADALSGNGPTPRNFRGNQTALELLKMWDRTTAQQRQQFTQDEYDQRRKEQEEKLSREFRINGKKPWERPRSA